MFSEDDSVVFLDDVRRERLIPRLPEVEPGQPRWRARFAAEALAIPAMREEMAAIAREAGFDPEGVSRVRLAVSEIAPAAVLAARATADDRPFVGITAFTAPDELQILIGHDAAAPGRCTRSPVELRLVVARQLCDHLSVLNEQHGTEYHLRFSRANENGIGPSAA